MTAYKSVLFCKISKLTRRLVHWLQGVAVTEMMTFSRLMGKQVHTLHTHLYDHWSKYEYVSWPIWRLSLRQTWAKFCYHGIDKEALIIRVLSWCVVPRNFGPIMLSHFTVFIELATNSGDRGVREIPSRNVFVLTIECEVHFFQVLSAFLTPSRLTDQGRLTTFSMNSEHILDNIEPCCERERQWYPALLHTLTHEAMASQTQRPTLPKKTYPAVQESGWCYHSGECTAIYCRLLH